MGSSKHEEAEGTSNPSTGAATFAEILEERLSRRSLLKGGLGAAALGLVGAKLTGCAPAAEGAVAAARGALSFIGVPVSTADTVVVPEGYVAEVLLRWGDPVSDGPAFQQDASNTAAEQELQAGQNHDGQHYFPLPRGSQNPVHGILAMNHEYTDEGLLHPDGLLAPAFVSTAEKVAKSQAAVGVSLVEVRRTGQKWSVVRPSPYGRRITARTPCAVSGPAAGHASMKTAADPTGALVLGTFQGCSYGVTPWGTFLTCEENFNTHFINASGNVPAAERRYGVVTGPGQWNHWAQFDERFNSALHPNEFNRFGWVVEIDPYDPTGTPVKRTALGRFKREGAMVSIGDDGRLALYSGDDERFEYVYKFVTARAWNPHDRAANRDLLDEGTLYVARFDAGGGGQWLELTYGKNGLDETNGFASQADVVVNARRAGDVVGATRMDRPEWIVVRPSNREVYCALTNNNRRGTGTNPTPDAANPRTDNVYGHIIRWREAGGDVAATSFDWDIFVMCGDPAHPDPSKRGNISGDIFGSPDGLMFDDHDVLWIGTDISTSVMYTAPNYLNFGNNALLAADPNTGEIRRFLTGPRGCELTASCMTPDGTTMFVQIQHPGETPSELSDPNAPTAVSTWPDGPGVAGRPRASTIAIRRLDGGPIGQ